MCSIPMYEGDEGAGRGVHRVGCGGLKAVVVPDHGAQWTSQEIVITTTPLGVLARNA